MANEGPASPAAMADIRGGIGREEEEQAERQYRAYHESRAELSGHLPALRSSLPHGSVLAPPRRERLWDPSSPACSLKAAQAVNAPMQTLACMSRGTGE